VTGAREWAANGGGGKWSEAKKWSKNCKMQVGSSSFVVIMPRLPPTFANPSLPFATDGQ
jgi:hypothetical protein